MNDEIQELLQTKTTRNFLKDAFKEAVKEWLDDMFAAFGRWSLMGIGAAAVAGLGYFLLTVNGWHK
jgi:hypothetical protein